MPGAAELLLAHHPKKDYARCCFPIPGGLHLCGRCLGGCIGMAAALVLPVAVAPWVLLGTVALAFFHWGSEQLGLLVWGRYTRLGVGFAMGIAYVAALKEALFSSPLPALAAAAVSISLFAVVVLAKSRRMKNGKKGFRIGV